MKRRDFFSSAGLITLASLTDFPSVRSSVTKSGLSSSGGQVDTKRFLFFDLWKLDYWDNCELKQGSAAFVPEATYEDKIVPNMGAGKPSVYFDENQGVWRLLYNIGWSPVRLMAAISDDGIEWRPDPHPEIEISPEAGERIASHHIYTLKDAAAGGLYCDPVASDGFPYKIYTHLSGDSVYQRAFKDRQHPLHARAQQGGDPRTYHEGRILVSKDALHWTLHPEYDWARADWFPEPPYFGFYNRAASLHTMLVRPGWGDRRVGLQSTEDFRRWSEPELLLQMDALDQQPVGFYAMPVIPYSHMYVGLLWVFHNSSSRPVNSFNQFYGTMDAQLTYSYDGIRFFRGLRQSILPLNPYPLHGCTQLRPYSVIEREEEIRIYSGASRAPHGLEGSMRQQGMTTNAIVMHRLRKDGWMYLSSKGHWARLQTKPMGIWSSEILLNAAAPYGEVRYQVTDEASRPIEGYTFDACVPLKFGDATEWNMVWKGVNVSDLIGKVIRIEIEFFNAHIYSLTAAYHMLDAQDQWLLKDGKAIDPSRFDH